MKLKTLTLSLFSALIFSACQQPAAEVETQDGPDVFGITETGDTIQLYTLSNESGMEVDVINYGGIITAIRTADKNGEIGDVVLGFDNIESYEGDHPFFGALIGRYGNRIAKGKFTLDSTEYTLLLNDGVNTLHGGPKGFHKVVWAAEPFENQSGDGIKLTYVSPDGDMGYPGNLTATVSYLLTADNALEVSYEATTDKKTVVNLTQHTYFNLSGDAKSILDHKLMLNADSLVPVDSTLIPTGAITSVEGTPFDFTTAKPIGRDIEAGTEQLKLGLGYDHCWVLNGENGTMKTAATLYDPASGRLMKVATTEPGIQFYSGNFLDGSLSGKGSISYQQRSALCLETQHYPDAPNQPQFPSTVLLPGEKYHSKTVFTFSVK